MLFHEDRRPAEDPHFWKQAHPVTAGHFEPFGPRWFRLHADGSANADPPAESRLPELLAEFAGRAEQALGAVEADGGGEPDQADLDALRGLGYVR
jgi:hypothetical protein